MLAGRSPRRRMKYGNHSRPNGSIHAHAVAVGDEPRLQVAADAVQHLELESIGGDPLLGRPPAGEVDHRRVVRGDRRIGARCSAESSSSGRTRRPRRPSSGRRPICGSRYAPLTSRTRAPSALMRSRSCLGAVQIRLQHDANLPVALLPRASRRSRASRRCTASSPCRCGRRIRPARPLEDASQVVDGGGAVDVEAELRQLQREVAPDARCDDGADDVQVVARGGVGFGEAS